MPDVSMMKMNAVTFQQARVMNLSNLIMVTAPQFSPGQLKLLEDDPKATIHSLDNQAWISLEGWIDDVTKAKVQCRRSGLTVQIPRRQNVTAATPALLAEDANFPAASLTYNDKTGAKQHQLEITLDSQKGFLQLQLNFDPDGKLYDEVFTAMTTPSMNIALTIDYAHSLQVKVPAAAPPTPPPPSPPSPLRRPIDLRNIRIRPL